MKAENFESKTSLDLEELNNRTRFWSITNLVLPFSAFLCAVFRYSNRLLCPLPLRSLQFYFFWSDMATNNRCVK